MSRGKNSRSRKKKTLPTIEEANVLAEELSKLLCNDVEVVAEGGILISRVSPEVKANYSSSKRISYKVPREELIEFLGLDGLTEEEKNVLLDEDRLPSITPALVVVLKLAKDMPHAKELAAAIGCRADDVEVFAGTAPRWCRSLLELVQFDVPEELIERYWQHASVVERIDAAIALRKKGHKKADEYYAKAWSSFDEEVYTPALMPLLLGVEEGAYLSRKQRLFKLFGAERARGPEWVIVDKTLHKDLKESIKQHVPSVSKKGKSVSPIVNIGRPLADAEEAIDLLNGNTYVLRSKKKRWVFILCPDASEIYVVSPDGLVTTLEWQEYVNKGFPFVFSYLPPDDTISLCAVNPQKKVTLKKLLKREQVAGLLAHFGYNTLEKLDDFSPDVAQVILRLQPAPPKTPERIMAEKKEQPQVVAGAVSTAPSEANEAAPTVSNTFEGFSGIAPVQHDHKEGGDGSETI